MFLITLRRLKILGFDPRISRRIYWAQLGGLRTQWKKSSQKQYVSASCHPYIQVNNYAPDVSETPIPAPTATLPLTVLLSMDIHRSCGQRGRCMGSPGRKCTAVQSEISAPLFWVRSTRIVLCQMCKFSNEIGHFRIHFS